MLLYVDSDRFIGFYHSLLFSIGPVSTWGMIREIFAQLRKETN